MSDDYVDYVLEKEDPKKMGATDSQVVVFDDCFCSRETEKAILVVLPDHDEMWIPKSQVHDDSEVYQENDNGTLIVSRWFADKEGFTKQGTVEFRD